MIAAPRAAAGTRTRTAFCFVFQWEFIFVRHYVRMWFTSCMIVGLDRGRVAERFWVRYF